MQKLLYILWAFAIGALFPLQAGINSSLGRASGSGILAAAISFTGGTLVLYVLLYVTRSAAPSFHQLIQLPFWMFTGGLLGAMIVFTTLKISPHISILTYSVLALGGQLLIASLLDHYGLLGYEKVSLNLWRVLGVMLVIIGAFMTRIR